MKGFITILPLAILLFCTGAASSPSDDGFGAVKCGSDIPKALIGRVMRNDRVVAIEARHKDLGLSDLGGTEITDKIFSISWMICGQEYMLLENKRSIVTDVLLIPEHSKKSPEFIGDCKIKGAKAPVAVVAILENEEGKKTLAAKMAWKIDTVTGKFIKLDTEGLRCPRSGIITADGGQ